MNVKDILSLKTDEGLTIRGYLQNLLEAVWRERECFSGKYGIGESGWEYDLYIPLINAGIVSGEIDEDGCVDGVDTIKADGIINECIKDIFNV